MSDEFIIDRRLILLQAKADCRPYRIYITNSPK